MGFLADFVGTKRLKKNPIILQIERVSTFRGYKMIIPIRCFTCGKVIGDKWIFFSQKLKQGDSPKEVLDELGVKRYCCRRILLSHVDLIDDILKLMR